MGLELAPNPETCACYNGQRDHLVLQKFLGMDQNYAEVSLLVCPICGTFWVHYLYELEAFTASGRWYMGAISVGQASILHADNAKPLLEQLDWYFYGGSYFEGRTGRASGRVIEI